MADSSSRLHGRTLIASSWGLRGHHSTFDIPTTSTPAVLGIYYDPSVPGSSIQPPLRPSRMRMPPSTLHGSYFSIAYHTYDSSSLQPYSNYPISSSYDSYVSASSSYLYVRIASSLYRLLCTTAIDC